MKYTKKQIENGFKQWEKELRLDPKSFSSFKKDRLECSADESAIGGANCLIKYMDSQL